jgi:hypothetical protein
LCPFAIDRRKPRTWLEHRCIAFSQHYDTAYWIASELAKTLPGELVAVSAGTGRSGMFRGGEFASIEREAIRRAVRKRSVLPVVATEAACEGLNLQTLGTLITVDLPRNPSRLEPRLGRVKSLPPTANTGEWEPRESAAGLLHSRPLAF